MFSFPRSIWAAIWENVPYDVRTTKTQIIHAVRSGSSFSTRRNSALLAVRNAPSADSDQSSLMRRLIWIFAGITWTVTKTYPYDFDPLKHQFYIVKLGFTGVYIIYLLFLLENINCGYSLEPPRRGGSNEHPQSMFWAEIWKISEIFVWKFSVLGGEFSIYLNRRVFVMKGTFSDVAAHMLIMYNWLSYHLLSQKGIWTH